MSITDYFVLYTLARTDLPSMGVGKAAAHMVHAGNKFTYDHLHLLVDEGRNPVKMWHVEGNGFGTTISLHSKNEVTNNVLMSIHDEHLSNAKPYFKEYSASGLVVDPTYPYVVDSEIVGLIDKSIHTKEPIDLGNGMFLCHREEITAMYVFGLKSDLEPIMKGFGLMPNVHVSKI